MNLLVQTGAPSLDRKAFDNPSLEERSCFKHLSLVHTFDVQSTLRMRTPRYYELYYSNTDKIQIPSKRSLTGNDSRHYGLSLFPPLNDIPRVSAILRVDCTFLWNRLFPPDERCLSTRSLFSSLARFSFAPNYIESLEKPPVGRKWAHRCSKASSAPTLNADVNLRSFLRNTTKHMIFVSFHNLLFILQYLEI